MVPSLRMPTAPSLKDLQSSLRRAVPAASDSMSSSDRPFIVVAVSGSVGWKARAGEAVSWVCGEEEAYRERGHEFGEQSCECADDG